MKDKIIVKGAKENNLKNLNIELPRNKIIVLTGISGSGKTSLAFDTIYAEGQRRYIESLSSYARQFLGQMEKPNVESIEGLSPSISIDQKQRSKNPRSTVGTITEIYDYFRLLYAKIGKAFCYNCGKAIIKQTVTQMIDKIMKIDINTKIFILAPIIRGKKGEHSSLLNKLKKEGYVRIKIDGFIKNLSDKIILEKNKKHEIEVLIDRLIVEKGIERRLADSLELALILGKGIINIETEKGKKFLFSEKFVCPSCEISIEEIEPRLFSFNSPYGYCPDCLGLGFKQMFSEDLIVPNKELSLKDGAINIMPWNLKSEGYYYSVLDKFVKHIKFSLNKPYRLLKKEQKKELLYGSNDKILFEYSSKNSNSIIKFKKKFEGIIPYLKRKYQETISAKVKKEIEKLMEISECETCKGKKLRKEALSIYINNKNIYDISSFSIEKALNFIENLKLSDVEKKISEQILKEIINRLIFLKNVGLKYLTLRRNATTLSGGESQRIRLATQIGSGLVGVLYILDEPSIGLHQKDNSKLIKALSELRDIGNTIIIVEHDEEMILSADFLVDIGPKAGKNGGNIIAKGTPKEVSETKGSLTGEYLSKKRKIEIPKKRRKLTEKKITIVGAKANNLKNITVDIPLGTLNAITGVSGSGKSTLINEVLLKKLSKIINKKKEKHYEYESILGIENIDKIINIDQSPIGRTPRSNAATYVGVFDFIRNLFSLTKESKARGYNPGRFSFNLKGGRCEACKGDGIIKIEMHFLPDVYILCEECKGKRYNRETLDIVYKNKTIYEILEMTIEEAYYFFKNIPKIKNKLEILLKVGLGYMKIGQSATTLSGGEAQRIKLAEELSKKGTGKTIYILDEPTTGLHFYDIQKLLNILQALVDKGNTVIVIEHNLDVIKSADFIIDLGIEGGDEGGYIVAKGTPEEISNNKNSYTGFYLKKILKGIQN